MPLRDTVAGDATAKSKVSINIDTYEIPSLVFVTWLLKYFMYRIFSSFNIQLLTLLV